MVHPKRLFPSDFPTRLHNAHSVFSMHLHLLPIPFFNLFNYPNNIWRKLHIAKLLSKQFSSALCCSCFLVSGVIPRLWTADTNELIVDPSGFAFEEEATALVTTVSVPTPFVLILYSLHLSALHILDTLYVPTKHGRLNFTGGHTKMFALSQKYLHKIEVKVGENV
jgi:hypothetical protein